MPPNRVSSPDRTTAYARDVVAGVIVAGPQVRMACRRHLRDLETGADRGLRFDPERAARVFDYFETVLRLNSGVFEGRPFILQPWQAFIVGSIFGWIRIVDGTRRFRQAFILIGKGNGKSPLAAGIGLYCLTSDGEKRAQVYAAAAKRDQAAILFDDAVAMRDQSPDLRRRIRKTGGAKPYNLAYIATGSYFRTVSFDKRQSGHRPHCALIDEIHEHPSSEVVDMMLAGAKGRTQPLVFEITNAGVERESICFAHAEYSRRIVEGADANDEWFAYVAELDVDDDPHDPETGPACWIKANPNLGISIQPGYIAAAVQRARGMPSERSKVDRLNFCKWADAFSPWCDWPLWVACENDRIDALHELADAETIALAVDLSQTDDLTALTICGRVGDSLVARTEYWKPADQVSPHESRDKVPYRQWIDDGHMHSPPGRVVDYSFVARRIAELQAMFPNLRYLAYDAYRMNYLIGPLEDAGVTLTMVPHPQGALQQRAVTKSPQGEPLPILWMPRSVELLEKAVADQTLVVEASPVLRWNAANAVLKTTEQGNRFFDKKKSTGRIDGLVTLAMSLGIVAENSARSDIGQALFDPVIV